MKSKFIDALLWTVSAGAFVLAIVWNGLKCFIPIAVLYGCIALYIDIHELAPLEKDDNE